jgi:hypothetical protein
MPRQREAPVLRSIAHSVWQGRRHCPRMVQFATGSESGAKTRRNVQGIFCQVRSAHHGCSPPPRYRRSRSSWLMRHSIGPPSSFFPPLATTTRASSGSGRWSLTASAIGAVIQRSIASGVLRMTGIAFGWNVATSSFGSVVKKAKMSLVVSPSFTFRTDVHRVQMPAKQANGG